MGWHVPPGQIYFQNAGCTGTVWLNEGGDVGVFMWGKHAVGDDGAISGNPNGSAGLMVPANVNANGYALSVSFSANVLKNYESDCPPSSPQTNSGWVLTPITNAAVGLPTTITPPITLQ